MFFTITPFNTIGKQSFYLSNHYVGKDDNNSLVGWSWEISYTKRLIDGKFVEDCLPKRELRKMVNQIQRGKILAIEHRYLNKAGEMLLHDVFNQLGAFKFSIYEDDKAPATNLQFINISHIKEHLLLSFDNTLVVADKNNICNQKIPLYHTTFYQD